MIVDACIPLLFEHGAAVTTKQIADAAGIAEGTLFRAFGDKESIVQAAVDRFLDPEPIRRALSYIDPELSLEDKVNDILFHVRSRLTGILGIMSAVGMRAPAGRKPSDELTDVIARVLEGESDRLRLPPAEAASFIRMVAFAATIHSFHGHQQIDTADLANLLVGGIGNGTG